MSDMNEQARLELMAISTLVDGVNEMADKGLDHEAVAEQIIEAYADMGIHVTVDIKVIGAYKPPAGGGGKKKKPSSKKKKPA